MSKRSRKHHGRRPDMITSQTPPVTHQEPPVQDRPRVALVWPDGEPMPTHYVKLCRRPLPCPGCRTIRLADLSQAVVCTQSGADTAFFRCKRCGHRWELPVWAVEG